MASEILKIVPIGNSKGVRIPSSIIRKYGITNDLEMVETCDGIYLRPRNSPKLSFVESFRQMAADRDAMSEVAEFDATLADGLDDE